MPSAMVALLIAVVSSGSGAVDAPPAEGELVHLVLVRHAEAGHDSRDPELTPRGRERALCLASDLEARGVTHLFASPFRRTAATLEPLAQRTGKAVAVRDPLAADELAAELAALPAGSVAVVAGHSDTLPLLAASLGRELSDLEDFHGRRVIPRDEHDRVVALQLRPGPGEPSERLAGFEEARMPCPSAEEEDPR